MINKVLIINPINYWFETLRPPFGLLTIATKFLANKVEVIWIDADVMRNDNQAHTKVKQHLDADLIALGGMHTAYRYIKEFCRYLREEDINLPVLIGGRIASSIDHLIWSNIPNVNMLCKQEGEYVIDSICKNFDNMTKILGVEYRQDGRIIGNEPAPIVQNMDEIPPLCWELLSHEYYGYPRNTGRLITSRGCPFRCHFCRTGDHKPDKYRPMSVEQVMQDVEYMVKNHGVRRVVFMEFAEDVELPEHAHADQVGFVLRGKIELTIDGVEHVFKCGDVYHIPAGIRHSGKIHAGYADVTFFDDPNRYQPKKNKNRNKHINGGLG